MGDVLSWTTFADIAREAWMPRLCTLIDVMDANLDGAALGTKMGRAAWNLAEQFAAGTITKPDVPFHVDPIA